MRRFNFIFFLAVVGFTLLGPNGQAQTLSPSDSLVLANLRLHLPLPQHDLNTIDSLYKLPIERLQKIDKEINRISRLDIPQAEKDVLFAKLREEKKTLKDERELSILLQLSEADQAIYLSKVVPVKPAVLHMGSNHDRASCTVCIKPN